MIGHIAGVKIGQLFPNRKALHDAHVHRGLMQGIAPEGSSIVLSGGYTDDIDEGDLVVYTGEGGRDASTERQISDQQLTRGNLALARNYVEGNPVRVNRGSTLDSKYAPLSGYRYDGLYRIESYWSEKGKDGFRIWRFRLVRIENQPPLGQLEDFDETKGLPRSGGTPRPSRTNVTTSRLIINSTLGNLVKEIYNHECQICGLRLETPTGPYAECCHIKPLGRPHNGPDTLENLLCLCPNHHVLFDAHAIHLSDDHRILETGDKIRTISRHDINIEYINIIEVLLAISS
jgi:putative restriction endonuclease